MTKKALNQNGKYTQELINTIEADFIFNNKPINRFVIINNENTEEDKIKKINLLRKKIDSIENCNLKINSKNLVMGEGNINSPIMLIGETPGEIEDISGLPFKGEIGNLLQKMLS